MNEAWVRKQKQLARKLKKSNWWQAKLQQQHCYHCDQKFALEELTMDHLIPMSKGGHSDRSNVVVSCKPCNTLKNSQWPWEVSSSLKL